MSPEMLFECEDGFMRPVLLQDYDGTTREPDGHRYLTAEQARDRFGFSVQTLENAYGAYARELLDSTSPARLAMEDVVRKKYSYLSEEHYAVFREQCRRLQFSPLGKGIWPKVKYNSTTEREELSVELSADGFFTIAMRTKEVAEFIGPEWTSGDGHWSDCWVSEELPASARFGVRRVGMEKPIFMVANWRDYAPTQIVEGRPILDEFWMKMPSFMLGKCASCLALRRAFPEQFSGIYGREEMMQSGNPPPANKSSRSTPKPPAAREIPEMETSSSLELELLRLGMGTKDARNWIEEFKTRWAILYSRNVVAWYRAVFQEVASNPAKYGAEPEAVGA